MIWSSTWGCQHWWQFNGFWWRRWSWWALSYIVWPSPGVWHTLACTSLQSGCECTMSLEKRVVISDSNYRISGIPVATRSWEFVVPQKTGFILRPIYLKFWLSLLICCADKRRFILQPFRRVTSSVIIVIVLVVRVMALIDGPLLVGWSNWEYHELPDHKNLLCRQKMVYFMTHWGRQQFQSS